LEKIRNLPFRPARANVAQVDLIQNELDQKLQYEKYQKYRNDYSFHQNPRPCGEKNKRCERKGDLSGRKRAIDKRELAFLFVDFNFAAVLEFAEQDFIGQYPLDLVLNEPGHGTRAEGRVIAVLR